MTLRVLELYCGIGGCSAALEGCDAITVGAFDQSLAALSVYRHNFPQVLTFPLNIETSCTRLSEFEAELWWMSPPCQPYTVRGSRRDLDDPRSQSLIALLKVIPVVGPTYVALENVEGFGKSRARKLLLDVLEQAGYVVAERVLCPSQLRVPNRRPRYYLVACRKELLALSPLPFCHRRLTDYLDPSPPSDLDVEPSQLARFSEGMHIVDPESEDAYSTCFTSAYGKSVMHAGSYVKRGNQIRRFSPEEIARLLHFPAHFTFPPELTLRQRWHLVGNSLSVIAVRQIFQMVPELSNCHVSY